MQSFKRYLPRDIFDDSGIDLLMNLTNDEISPIFEDCLLWIGDPNWPIAKRMIEVIVKHYPLLDGYLPRYLSYDYHDPLLKAQIIKVLYMVPVIYLQKHIALLKRMMETPSPDEREEFFDDHNDFILDDYKKYYIKSLHKDNSLCLSQYIENRELVHSK
ncbi:MAG TPA: DUF5071 domain-containing protein [Paludibacter sp.]